MSESAEQKFRQLCDEAADICNSRVHRCSIIYHTTHPFKGKGCPKNYSWCSHDDCGLVTGGDWYKHMEEHSNHRRVICL